MNGFREKGGGSSGTRECEVPGYSCAKNNVVERGTVHIVVFRRVITFADILHQREK